ncbi:sialate O-acetylesterase [Niabella ginsenosidivorans]|uniref:Sialate O-acetylesterase n=1 Tax=Niabella ginsenosidivorans TaxID=1176587 RepID=A0A1A9HY55_9BACT|nr:sialate O-acetylesterase [Niabella ginsenosidivorans]ANH80317.1 sialate O-acetylesterase [Niabella ginsenosidivorans]
MKYLVTIAIVFTCSLSARGQLVLPKIIGNNMVVQQGQPVPVWGRAKAGAAIAVRFRGQVKQTVADAQGAWKVFLDPLKASSDPAELRIISGKEAVTLSNILVGEVWLCSGQSNMEFAMRKISKLQPPPGAHWPVNELETAHNTNIRIFLAERKKMAPDSTHSGWAVAEGTALRSFSAAGYFFAKELQAKLKVPVGVISAAIPGSRIEPWMPQEAFTALDFFREQKDSTHRIDGDPGKFYTPMIRPLIPFALKGFLWYQGESNCFLNERLQYSYKMKALISYWRAQWHNDKLPFYYVQIAPYYYSKATDRSYTVYSEPEFWEAQSAVLRIPNTAMISTLDLNDDPADLHPVNKWGLGRRLAGAALSKTYHASDAAPMGPVFKSAVQKKNALVIDFDYKGKGLVSRNGKTLEGFEVENEKGTYVTATAIIKDNKVWIRATDVMAPRAVRYAWREDARPSLYNKDGLPALPFRTNSELIKAFKAE